MIRGSVLFVASIIGLVVGMQVCKALFVLLGRDVGFVVVAAAVLTLFQLSKGPKS